jgi:hypothetical protein
MVPFPRLHFFMPGFAPLTARGSQQYRGEATITPQFGVPSVQKSVRPWAWIVFLPANFFILKLDARLPGLQLLFLSLLHVANMLSHIVLFHDYVGYFRCVVDECVCFRGFYVSRIRPQDCRSLTECHMVF